MLSYTCLVNSAAAARTPTAISPPLLLDSPDSTSRSQPALPRPSCQGSCRNTGPSDRGCPQEATVGSTGSSIGILVPPEGGLSSAKRPPSASTRSRRPTNPETLASAPPTP